jgi:hypothetical protein
MMRQLLLLFCVLYLAACNTTTDQATENKTDHTHLLDTIASTTAETPDTTTLPADDELQHYAVDTSDLSPEPTTAIKILIEGRFHKQEVWQGAEKKQWMGLVLGDSTFQLQPMRLQVYPFFDPIYDKGKQVKSGREVRGEHANTLLFITGLNQLKAGPVDTVGYPGQVILPNTALNLRYKDKVYTLEASGDSVQQDGADAYALQNYSWTIKGTRNGKKISQELARDTDFESAIYVLLWVGDLDRDGIPDLLADLSNHYNTSKIVLFLSSKADKGKLYKRVAVFKSEAYPVPDSLQAQGI